MLKYRVLATDDLVKFGEQSSVLLQKGIEIHRHDVVCAYAGQRAVLLSGEPARWKVPAALSSGFYVLVKALLLIKVLENAVGQPIVLPERVRDELDISDNWLFFVVLLIALTVEAD